MRLWSIPTLFAVAAVTGALLPAQHPPARSESAINAGLSAEADAPAKTARNESTAEPLAAPLTPSANGRIRADLEVLTTVLDRYRKSGNRMGEAGTLCALANSYDAMNQQQKAIEHLQLALAIFREKATRQDEARTLSRIGDVYRAWGFPDQAARFYRDSLVVFSQTDDSQGRAVAFNNLGVAYLALGNKKKSIEYLDQALSFYRARNDHRAVALTLNNLGMVSSSLENDAQKALSYFQRAMTELQLTDDRDSEGTVLDNIGAVCVKLGRRDMAEVSFDRALELFRRTGDTQGELRVRRHLRKLGDSGTLASSQSSLAH